MAKDLGACMLFLPECFGFMGESSAQTLEQAEAPVLEDRNSNDDRVTAELVSTVSGKSKGNSEIEGFDRVYLLDGLRTIARESGLWMSGGGMHVSGAPPDPASGNQRVYNTHIILDDQGEVKAIYRKVHLFDVSIPGKVELKESATTAPGTELVVCDSPIGQ
jgi:predicted amidohydrolase